MESTRDDESVKWHSRVAEIIVAFLLECDYYFHGLFSIIQWILLLNCESVCNKLDEHLNSINLKAIMNRQTYKKVA